MRIAICDDHKETVSQLSQSVKEYFAQQPDLAVTICEYYDGQGLLDGYDTQQYDIIFLDIEMPGLSGMDVAKELRLRGCDALLVFVTAYAEFMAASFHVETFDFLKFQSRKKLVWINTVIFNRISITHNFYIFKSWKCTVHFMLHILW